MRISDFIPFLPTWFCAPLQLQLGGGDAATLLSPKKQIEKFKGGSTLDKFNTIMHAGIFGPGVATKFAGWQNDLLAQYREKNKKELPKVNAAAAPGPGPSAGDSITSARTIMGRVASRAGRSSTILSTQNSSGLRTILGTPLS